MFYLITILYLFLGFSFALSILPGFDVHIVRIVVPVIFLVWLVYGALHKKLSVPRGVISFFFISVFLWSSLSLFYSDVPAWTIRKLLFLYSLIPLFFVVVHVFTTQKQALARVVAALVYGGGAAAAVGTLQFSAQFLFGRDTVATLWSHLTPFFLGQTFSASVAAYNSWYVHVAGVDLFRAIAFFPDPHVFSMYLGMITPFALLLFVQKRQMRWLIITTLLILANLLTFSRGGEIALGVGTIAFFTLIFPLMRTRIKHYLFVGGIVVVVLLGAMGGTFFERFISSFDPTDTSATSRIVLWQEAVEHIEKRPLLGTGVGAYAYAVNPRAEYRTPIYAHNTYLDIAVEVGLIGCALWGALIISLLWVLWRKRMHLYAQAGILSIVILGTHGLFDTALFSIHIFTIVILIVAIGAAYEQKNTILSS